MQGLQVWLTTILSNVQFSSEPESPGNIQDQSSATEALTLLGLKIVVYCTFGVKRSKIKSMGLSLAVAS